MGGWTAVNNEEQGVLKRTFYCSGMTRHGTQVLKFCLTGIASKKESLILCKGVYSIRWLVVGGAA